MMEALSEVYEDPNFGSLVSDLSLFEVSFYINSF